MLVFFNPSWNDAPSLFCVFTDVYVAKGEGDKKEGAGQLIKSSLY